MKTLFTIQIIDILSKVANDTTNKRLNISTVESANSLFNKVYRLGIQFYGKSFISKLSNIGVKNSTDFAMLLSSESFMNDLADDTIGKKVITQIKYPSAAKIAKEMNDIHNKYRDQIIFDENSIEDINQTYAIRTKLGNGPVVFVKGVKTNEGRHEVRRWYAWANKINYFEVRECSYEFWANNPETQIATNI